MDIVHTAARLRRSLAAARKAGRRVGFVPTMGYLHEGHMRLCDLALAECDLLVLSVFVNPLQFGPGEDLARYPRDLERDAALARERGVHVLYAPDVDDMYPEGGTRTYVTSPALSGLLCGAYRPGHFDGVLTVVAKLFQRVAPAVAVFGQKDLQQAALVRRMVRDLDFPVAVRVAPIVREPDGLAMSSRNVYLSPSERQSALALSAALRAADAAFRAGETDADRLRAAAAAVLRESAGVRVQYLELVATDTLEPVARVAAGDAIALAAHVGSTRLIDNHIFGAEQGSA